VAQIPEQVVSGWVDAFNERDLDGMLVRLDPDVSFYPLKLGGLGGSYRGHDGVREWFAQLMGRRSDYRMAFSDVCAMDGGKVFAVGSLSLVGQPEISPFCTVHQIDRGLIVAAYHYLSDPEMIEYLGLIP
jgi:hypothetical protein